MDSQDMAAILLEKYERAKEANEEIVNRAENKRTGGQLIAAETQFKCLEEICIEFGIIKK